MKYSHFENIGFGPDINEMFEQTIKRSKHFIGKNYRDFDYLVYNDKNIFLVYTVKGNQVMTLNPHFQGKSNNKISLKRFDNNLAGDCMVMGWIEPSEDLEQGLSPIYFNFYDYFVSLDFKVPRLENIQLTAFAHDFEIYKDINTFSKVKTFKLEQSNEYEPNEFSFSHDYFIAVGLFDDEINPIAQFAATVNEVNIVKNSLTNKQFYHIFAKGMVEVDIVYPFEKDLKIEVGNIIDGTFWLSGTIVQ